MTSRWSVPGDEYQERFDRLVEAGADVHGEADFVMSLAPRRVLDAGCGTGRVAIELGRRGVTVAGVDRDPGMLATARRRGPDLEWVLADLADCMVEPGTWDVVVAAGNVMIFLDAGAEPAVVANLARHLGPGGLLVAGFQLGGGRLDIDVYDAACSAAGLVADARFATWDREPWDGGDYAVTVSRKA